MTLTTARALAEKHYVLAPGFITPWRAAGLAAEFAEVERQGAYTVDGQAPNSPALFNFLPFVRLLVEKVPQVSEMVGEPVLPTYAYARSYKHGEVLKRHRDRDACEISFTLNLAQDVDWPIHVQSPNGEEVAVNLKPGDAMMYLGCDADHWRERYTGKGHMQLFLHYVRAYGPRAYTFFNLALTPHGENQHPAQVGRNVQCPCGSGKRFKHCHGSLAVSETRQ